ncbi:ATP-grasp domain-containing protein [Sphingomonas xanthus]|uniref:Transporter n=1 Tax=Sphingomonas xanthus TaxID=2594473 RepID=A0A516IS92_9SPHN|nr:hypothetical protein [Sphingomonas xanthus]QDP19775.1 hypothetical protein FMM02_07295 [Sphingomonas xanthus]
MRAAVLVPAPTFPEAYDWAYDVEAAVLERGGFEVTPLPWTDVADVGEFDVVLPLVTWGYHLDPSRWHGLLDQLEHERIPTINPVPLLRWNSDKRYLAELAGKDIAVIPTRSAKAMNREALASARETFGPELVIKPPISASADGTHRLGPGDDIPATAIGRPMLIQPFLPSVTTEGEYSLMLFGGRFSHAVVKRPKSGDYRVQPHLGGSEMPCAPPDGAVELARAALAAAPAAATYARVDMVRGPGGELAIIELELIEPSLWLQHAPDGGASFAAAVRDALK